MKSPEETTNDANEKVKNRSNEVVPSGERFRIDQIGFSDLEPVPKPNIAVGHRNGGTKEKWNAGEDWERQATGFTGNPTFQHSHIPTFPVIFANRLLAARQFCDRFLVSEPIMVHALSGTFARKK